MMMHRTAEAGNRINDEVRDGQQDHLATL